MVACNACVSSSVMGDLPGTTAANAACDSANCFFKSTSSASAAAPRSDEVCCAGSLATSFTSDGALVFVERRPAGITGLASLSAVSTVIPLFLPFFFLFFFLLPSTGDGGSGGTSVPLIARELESDIAITPASTSDANVLEWPVSIAARFAWAISVAFSAF